LEPVIADVTSSNIEALVDGADIVLDGSDNFELRFLINDVCVKKRIPWVYGGAVAASGACMSIVPGGPCLRCAFPVLPAAQPNCVNDGIINMITGIVSCLEAAEAVKILTCPQAVSKKYLAIDLWNNSMEYIDIQKNPHCPVCGT
jgi:adenylyltransferase/sulfurtransferase